MANKEYICRCEEVTREMIEAAIADGNVTLDAVKKHTRAGMGFCQGKSCKRLIAGMIAKETGCSVSELLPGSVRYPVGAVTLDVIANVGLEDD